ncbi:MAG: hypothetical protein IT438_16490 [Phycisphaerales bacterium]|nr:hypothetical protein [Phycisphaerales bacterium]
MQAANRRALGLDKSFGSLIGQLQSLGADGGKTGFPDLDKQLADLEKLREESNKLFRSGPFSQGERDEARNKELVEFQNKLAAEGEKIEATAAARRRARAEKEQQDRFDDAQRQIQAITREQLTEEERINDERERGIIEADALRRKAQDEFERQVADDLDAAVRARAEREMQLIRDRRAAEEQAATDAARERERREIEANRRIAEDMAEQMARALQDAYARGNAELLAGVNQVNSKLTVTANNILTVVRQLYANQPTGGR